MTNGIQPINIQPAAAAYQNNHKPPAGNAGHMASAKMEIRGQIDIVEFGRAPVSHEQSMNVVLERAFEQLRSVIADAKDALGIPQGAVLDTSPEATAGRIADFALGAYETWRGNHEELDETEARKQFAEFIGGAISQGIEEARGILGTLNALNPDVEADIGTTWDLVQQRLDDFVENGLKQAA